MSLGYYTFIHSQGEDVSTVIMEEKRASQHGQWSSRTAFIFAGAAAAVGLGNIWKFPYITGQNGGGLFVLIYIACVLVMGIPLMMAEITLGRCGRRNPAGALGEIAKDNNLSHHWRWVGGLTIMAGALILTYYCVIAGWSVSYFIKAVAGNFQNIDKAHAEGMFASLIAHPGQLIIWHTLVVMATVFVVARGLEQGIERVVKYLFPCLVFLLIALIIYGVSTGYFHEAFVFLFEPDFTEITSGSVLMAMGQAFFSLSLATGTILMYGAYVPRHVSITSAAVAISLVDTGIALAAGMAIFPVVFANGMSPSSGPGLIFQTLPIAFGHMPFGYLFALLFFLMLMFAAFTSTISLLEPPVAWCMETFHLTRIKASWLMGFFIWLIGIGTVLSFNYWSDLKLLGLNIFELIDYITANIMLPLGGLCVAIFTGWILSRDFIRRELQVEDRWMFRSWRFTMRYITPCLILLVFGHALGLF